MPTGGAAVSASTGAHTSAVTVTVPAGDYFQTQAGGVSSLLTTLQTELRNNVQSYPQSAAAMAAAVGYGTWTAGWLINETSGDLAAVFGSPTLTAVSSPTYTTGYQGGIDKAVGFDSASDAFSGGDVHDVTGTDDLVIGWVGYAGDAPAASRDWFSKGTGAACWYVYRKSSGVLNFTINDAVAAETTTAVPTGEWHAGLLVANRATNRARIGVIGLTSGTVSISSELDISAQGTFANASNFAIGSGAIASADTSLLLGAFYVGAGTAAGTGLSANLATALGNWKNCITSNHSVSMSTTTGLITASHSFWPSSISFTSTALRDVLGFEYDFDYPQTAAQMAAAVGYGSWSAGYLCNESSGNLASVFGTPATLTASSTPTYSNQGARGGSDKAVGFDSTSDSFSGGDVFDLTASTDVAVAWVGYHSASGLTGTLFSKYNGGATRGWLVDLNAGTLRFATLDGSSTIATAASAPSGNWYVGMAVADRSTGKIRVGYCSIGGSPTVSTEQTQALTTTNTQPFAIGANVASALNACTDFKVAAVYVAHGASAATGLSANLSTALSNFASYMKSQTSTQQARGVWFPDCPLDLEGDPAVAPKVTDTRTTRGPTGVVLGLSGNSYYRHRNLVWSHVPRSQVWEAAATYDNGSFETFANDALFGLGHAWFTPASPLQIYWNDAGTERALGYTYNASAGVSGWTVLNVDSVEPKKSSGSFTGLWRIEFAEVVSPG